MVSKLAGALLRAILIVVVIALPSIMVPGTNTDTAQIVALVALCAGALTLFEYAATYPGLVEFRDAPPFNRIRFFSLFAMVFTLSIVVRGKTDPTIMTEFVTQIGTLIGRAIDFPYSPVRLVVLMLPEGSSAADISAMRTAAGMTYLISLLSLGVFVIALRSSRWPANGCFNVWVNLPTFDPTAGGDVVKRLERDARFNIALGFLLPFVTPAVIQAASALFGSVSVANDQTLIWTLTAWAFLPASLFMRGIAMGRVALMISDERKKNAKAEQEEAWQPA
ncbi:hypothetical protein XMM379_001693 [Aliiroseovarius sp. xm-m-379]|uniref:Uncharacterized protein n=1 Tax=Aliiroseovarius crassostreae TaxID=154981 RepID=A0A9Q9HBW8_9RHOB|nr:hypothetical protein [Aliiroseovarius crassostreae]NRP13625.1 hypothetical protein [Aliiroseovarius sp. xm-d-517]NRP25003.1 hypothetical protein [Aliiroseovarius sp. xm-m-379]NRP31476.1 hypothetical protein [Aliiroseovarius sp. xm-m-314]NRP33802.1 hypothetical protein [Aliiroseovarius sp. xm-a-104]NRP41235.1 hypothetical protein [Aliiroseovarius sp. xm-m-339-2]NRP45290.1 hypothetical protein [Aliiroseovarius sp. xm-m-378]NRP50481.1 hypothetical protein [Aliiroseovarius sp. xm-m-354]NRP62